MWARSQSDPSKPVVILATALDSLTDFYNRPNAADTGVTLSIALTIAKALSNIAELIEDVEIWFMFFQGEAWGRVGSRKFLDDVQHFVCKRVVNITQSVFNNEMCYSPLKVFIFPPFSLALFGI